MLIAENIHYSIGSTKLLYNVSVAFEPGKLNLIIGPNGAGKSTLVKVLCNQLVPESGLVAYGGRNVSSISVTEQAKVRAVLSQNIELAFPLQVSDVVMMGRYPHFAGTPAQQDKVACEEAMRFFDVQHLAGRDYMTLSGGEKQRVHFARVLSQIWYSVPGSCRYLVLDEPLTFLDVRYQFGFMRQIAELVRKEDVVVVGVVHDLNLAAKFADQITLLHEGKVLANGCREQVLTKEFIGHAYHLEPVIYRDGNNMHLFFE